MSKKITESQLLAEGAKRSLRAFVELAWPIVQPSVDFVGGWHVDEVCDHLEAVTCGQLTELAITMPPGCMKSMLVQVFWQPWDWLHNPGSKWISASFDAGLTLRDARRSLQIMQSAWYRKNWGHLVSLPEKTQAEGDFKNLRGGERFSTSVRGKVTGRHGDRMVVDDAAKPLDISKLSLDLVEEWYRGTITGRMLPGGAKVIMAQRLHDRDLPGIAISEGFTLLRLPMVYETKFPCKTPWGGDRRTEDGELLWPARFPLESVEKIKKDLGSVGFAAQYQQRPVPAGGNVFYSDWFRHWTASPMVAVPNARVRTIPARFDRVILSVDAAFKDAATSDYVVIQVWGKKGPDFFLLDQVRERMGFEATCARILKIKKQWPAATTILIEDKANGSAIVEVLRKKIPGVIPVNPRGGKESRAQAVAPIHESGNVWDPDPAITPWVDEMRSELTSFPFGAHDDTVDARSQALTHLLSAGSSTIAAMTSLLAQKGGTSGFFGR